MNLLELADCTPEMAAQLGITFSYFKTGDPAWVRVFIISHEGTQVGRMNYFRGALYNNKFYKDKLGMRVPICESDFIYSKLLWMQRTGEVLSRETYDVLVERAERFVRENIQQKKDARPADGKKRKPIQGYDARYILRSLVEGRIL